MELWLLLASYGMCFGLMNDKAAWLTDRMRAIPFRPLGEGDERTTFFDRMLRCPYCTGFHTGWAVALVSLPVHGGSYTPVGAACSVVLLAFASAAFCYIADTVSQWVESAIR